MIGNSINLWKDVITFYMAQILPNTERLWDTHPSSVYTIRIVRRQPWYFISPGTGCGPWMRLLATSNGMLMQDAKVPAINPIRNLRPKSALGSCKYSLYYQPCSGEGNFSTCVCLSTGVCVSQHAPGQRGAVWYRGVVCLEGGIYPGVSVQGKVYTPLPPPPRWLQPRSVRIPLECILVKGFFQTIPYLQDFLKLPVKVSILKLGSDQSELQQPFWLCCTFHMVCTLPCGTAVLFC